MNAQTTTEFCTIRQAAARGYLSEHHLRLLLAQGKLPGVYSGNRFKVNVRLLEQQLDQMSAAAIREDA